jgi:hypothetical protein
MKHKDLLSTKLDQEYVDQKITSLLAAGAKIIDPDKEPEPDLSGGTFSNSWGNMYPELNPMTASKSGNTIGWDMYEHIGMAVYNPKAVTKMGIFSTVFQTLLERPLPGRPRCSLVARYNPDKQVVQVAVKHFLKDQNKNQFEAFAELGVIGLQGFESNMYQTAPLGDPYFLSCEDMLSAAAMNTEAVKSSEGPTWEQVRSDNIVTKYLIIAFIRN